MAYRHGHCTGHKRERTGATPAFDRIQAEHLARIEAAWAAKAAAKQTGQK